MTNSLIDALSIWLDSRLEDVHTAIPGKVTKYDKDTQTAEVVPSLSKLTIKDTEVAFPAISGVPIIFPFSQAFGLTWEVQKGDGVLLIFSEAALGAWVNSDGSKQITPEGRHRFSETDAIAIPGLVPKVVDPTVKIYIDKDGKLLISDTNDFKIEDANGNVFEMGTSSVKINGNLEVLQ